MHSLHVPNVPENSLCPAMYRVVPAGRNFYHILEVPSGRIKGFRSGHNQACALAKELEDTLHAINQSDMRTPC